MYFSEYELQRKGKATKKCEKSQQKRKWDLASDKLQAVRQATRVHMATLRKEQSNEKN